MNKKEILALIAKLKKLEVSIDKAEIKSNLSNKAFEKLEEKKKQAKEIRDKILATRKYKIEYVLCNNITLSEEFFSKNTIGDNCDIVFNIDLNIHNKAYILDEIDVNNGVEKLEVMFEDFSFGYIKPLNYSIIKLN